MGSAVRSSNHQESNMTQATEIMAVAHNATDACNRAEAITDNVDQDWTNEATIYTFDDESVLVVSGPQVNAYTDEAAARAAIEA